MIVIVNQLMFLDAFGCFEKSEPYLLAGGSRDDHTAQQERGLTTNDKSNRLHVASSTAGLV